MFSGIVENLGTVSRIENNGKGKRLYVSLGKSPKTGESISINGVCLTVTTLKNSVAAFDLMPETLKRTNLGLLGKNDKVNIERSVRTNDRNSGHFVMGHVDDVGTISERKNVGDFLDVRINCSRSLMPYIAEKGSIAVDGISLTIVGVKDDSFSVSLIPHTMKITTLGIKKKGDKVNLEVDMLARYVKNILDSRPARK